MQDTQVWSWRRKWQLTPVFLPRKFHGSRSLVDYSPWNHKESNMTEHAHIHICVPWLLSSRIRSFRDQNRLLSASRKFLRDKAGAILLNSPSLSFLFHRRMAVARIQLVRKPVIDVSREAESISKVCGWKQEREVLWYTWRKDWVTILLDRVGQV